MNAPDVNDLREHLRSLGYLDARVDRFVLGGAARRRTPLALAASASLRIGLLAGVLLGPAAAIGTASRLPGLVTNVADALVLAGYLAVCFGVAAALGACLVILPAGAIARRGVARSDFSGRARRAATGAGAVIALACLAYLTLWWRAATDATGLPSVVATAAVLAVAVAISLLIGHVVRLTALAYVARLGLGQSLAPVRPGASWAITLPLGAIALVGAFALLLATTPRDTGTAAPPLAIVPTGERVLVVAIDGVDLATVDRLRAAGRVPAFDHLLRHARASLATDAARDPARVWTTIATGQPPARHGIGALETRQLAGVEGRLGAASGLFATVAAATDLIRLTRPAIASGSQRRIPTFWEVAARAGLRTAVIHWWATWPADDQPGAVISDRAILRLEHGGPLDGEVNPPALYDTLRASWATRRARAATVAESVAPAGIPADTAALLRRSAALDATIIDLATDPALGPLDLLVLYLPGLDIAQHALFSNDAGAAVSPSVAAERVTALEAYYELLDRALGTLVAPSERDRLVVLVTEPGRVAQPSPGVLALAGGGAASLNGSSDTRADGTSVAATVLYALGVPVASDLASPALTSLFWPDFVAAHPVRTVATYGPRRPPPRRGTGQPLDQEMIERMRSLGYVR